MDKQEQGHPQTVVASVVAKANKKDKAAKAEEEKIELRSGEVQELMGRPPSAILKSGITVILVFVVMFFSASFFIVYPERIAVTARLFPSEDVTYMNSPADGRLLWVIDSMSAEVSAGDTLARIALHNADTACIVCNADGRVFKTDVLEKNMEVCSGQPLFHLSEKGSGSMLHEVRGVIYLPADSFSVLRIGQKANIMYKGHSHPFVITEFGKIANDEGRYPVSISRVDSLGLFDNVEPEVCLATVQVANQTVFEKFFAKRFNIVDKYRVN